MDKEWRERDWRGWLNNQFDRWARQTQKHKSNEHIINEYEQRLNHLKTTITWEFKEKENVTRKF